MTLEQYKSDIPTSHWNVWYTEKHTQV